MSKPQRGSNDEGISQALYLKRQSKSWEAFQQSVLMGILVKEGYTFDISVPEKYSNKVSHLFKIVSMEKAGQVFQIEEMIKEECQRLASAESKIIADVSQLKRHSDKNRVSIGLNILLKKAQEHGYDVKKRGTRGSKFTVIAHKFSEIYFNHKVFYDKAAIRSMGKQINDFLLKKCKSSVDRKGILVFSTDDLRLINPQLSQPLTFFDKTPSAFSKRKAYFNTLEQLFVVSL
ncbi:hypothetical protein EIN_051610 [Entamoeba invadens IP1]|uniref:hypothetical protein n=1 Tax=Entamoeba invadens IP1 TaxID=370355 RepID=UPI0002C3FBFC|nr:hypothetical protein EIN_051610 [Entamoeba invadens IP1]ELP92996.1 hypothetical protein EIN_051610 [Entamoeba invadens IP1]|eukprot:XP_004259767.1 hypothetical protein EIN_051610 [Entamoeba invadens IP1]